jgi:hypothetical protein
MMNFGKADLSVYVQLIVWRMQEWRAAVLEDWTEGRNTFTKYTKKFYGT